MSTVYARLDRSNVINALHDRFHLMLDGLSVQRLVEVDSGMSRAKTSVMAKVGTCAVEGLG